MDKFRRGYMMFAELLDVFRVVPRILVAGYVFMLYKVVDWYMNLQPYFPEEVKPMIGSLAKTSSDVSQLMVQAPTTQHAALVTAVVGIAAAVFGLYSSTGIKWSEYKFTFWKKKNDQDDNAND